MDPSAAALAWQQEQGRLISIAYRMLGDLGEAEDVSAEVAESALIAERRGESIRSWPAWMTTTCVRRSIDRLRSLAARRESYPGPWLPEPLSLERAPDEVAATRELLSISLLHMAEQLSADARAAVVLHRAFVMTAPEIGEILDRSPAAVRQLISRAERTLDIDDQGSLPREGNVGLLRELVAAIETGEVARVLELLDDSVTLWTDGGGKITAARRPVHGADAVARLLVGVFARGQRLSALMVPVRVNGEDGIDVRTPLRRDVTVVHLSNKGLVVGIRQICNPDKLTRI